MRPRSSALAHSEDSQDGEIVASTAMVFRPFEAFSLRGAVPADAVLINSLYYDDQSWISRVAATGPPTAAGTPRLSSERCTGAGFLGHSGGRARAAGAAGANRARSVAGLASFRRLA
jgi:hypothetical protein